MTTFYALRYVASTPLKERKHAHTLGRFETWASADDALATRPRPELLEVVQRGGRS